MVVEPVILLSWEPARRESAFMEESKYGAYFSIVLRCVAQNRLSVFVPCVLELMWRGLNTACEETRKASSIAFFSLSSDISWNTYTLPQTTTYKWCRTWWSWTMISSLVYYRRSDKLIMWSKSCWSSRESGNVWRYSQASSSSPWAGLPNKSIHFSTTLLLVHNVPLVSKNVLGAIIASSSSRHYTYFLRDGVLSFLLLLILPLSSLLIFLFFFAVVDIVFYSLCVNCYDYFFCYCNFLLLWLFSWEKLLLLALRTVLLALCELIYRLFCIVCFLWSI